jgi:hypothetical protein
MGLHRSRPICDRPREQPTPKEGRLRSRVQHVGNDEKVEDSTVIQSGERTLNGKLSTRRSRMKAGRDIKFRHHDTYSDPRQPGKRRCSSPQAVPIRPEESTVAYQLPVMRFLGGRIGGQGESPATKQESGMAAGGRTRNSRNRLRNQSDPGRPIMFLPHLPYERRKVASQFPLGQRENIIVRRHDLSSSSVRERG